MIKAAVMMSVIIPVIILFILTYLILRIEIMFIDTHLGPDLLTDATQTLKQTTVRIY